MVFLPKQVPMEEVAQLSCEVSSTRPETDGLGSQ